MQILNLKSCGKLILLDFHYLFFKELLFTFGYMLCIPLICSCSNLNAAEASIPLELFLAMSCMLLIPSIYTKEEDCYDLTATKKCSILQLYIVRIAVLYLILFICVLLFLVYMQFMGCTFSILEMLYGTCANMLFLGGLGLWIYVIFENQILSYMIPVCYMMLNLFVSYNQLGVFYLMEMSLGHTYNKIYILCSGMIMIVFSLLWRRYKREILK